MSDDAARADRPVTGSSVDPAPTGPLGVWKLVLGPVSTTWLLHEDEDPENVEARLESAGEHGEAVIKVHVPEATGAVLLHVRPGRSSWWTLVEVLDPTP